MTESNKYNDTMNFLLEIKIATHDLLEIILSEDRTNLSQKDKTTVIDLVKRYDAETIPELEKLLLENSYLFENDSFAEEIFRKISSIMEKVINFSTSGLDTNKVINFIQFVSHLHPLIKDINVAKHAWDTTQQIIDRDLRPLIDNVQEELSDIKRAKLTLQNDSLYNVFSGYETKLTTEADLWQRRFFIAIIGGATIIAILTISPFFCPKINGLNLNIWFLKLLMITLTITLSTYFLKRSIHIRKQADQMRHTTFELDALPSFMNSLSSEQSAMVTVELIGKYFGREIDQSQNDKIGDLLQDQVRAGTELIKASAEIVKSVKPNNNQ
ncbi:hypothetical protein [Acinetobacter courvalinii]|uniref:hypothetical protein n=1 Tax=Acinetobacter courvalinii TaxID=280147 RepID=UPI0019003704|nr:hypothetical protein [Acinetobacter courvalinii]MBJ8418768.1 hypothetical protein [Acinetobacter courvalinii]